MTRPRPGVILLVEDNDDDADLTRRAFQRARIANELVVVGDGTAALDWLWCAGEYADRDPVLPDVVLLDLNLPKLDGLGVLQRLRADPRTRALPVVVLTTSDAEDDVVQSYSRGANSYVRKPVDFTEFMDAAGQLGLYWLVLNTPPRLQEGAGQGATDGTGTAAPLDRGGR